MSCLFGCFITNPNIRLAAQDGDFLRKADTMLNKLAKDHMGQMSGKKKAEVLESYNDTLTNLFHQEDHPTCEQAVANAVKVLEKDWQAMSDQIQNQDNEMDLDIEEDVDMEEVF
jgi:hypothetical protein